MPIRPLIIQGETDMTTYSGTYVATLDDDVTVYRKIELALRVQNHGFIEPVDLLSAIINDNLEPTAFFIDLHLRNGQNGLNTIPSIRSHFPYTPIIVVTGSQSEAEIHRCFLAGANDFIRKNYTPSELEARYKVRVLESSYFVSKEVLRFGDIELVRKTKTLEGPLLKVKLSPIDLDFFFLLANHKGQLVSREVLKNHCWHDASATDTAFNRKVNRMRKILRKVSTKTLIHTEYRAGASLLFSDEIKKVS